MVGLSQLSFNPPDRLRPPSDRPQRPPVRKRITQRDRDRIAELYASGLSFAAVAEEAGVARSTAMRIVRERGVKVRPWGVTYQGAHGG